MDNNRGLMYFCIGCAAGAAGAMLVNSKSARAGIDYVRGKADESVNSVKESVEKLGNAVNNAAAHRIKTVRHQAENLSAAVDAGKEAYREARQTTP